jgi:uncharacterized HAD superfamily protein
LLYDHDYNQGLEDKNIIRVNNWQHIYKIIHGKK